MPQFKNIANQRGFTLIELLTVIAIIGVLVAILIPVVGQMRRSGHQTKSANNLRQIAAAASMWSNDNRGRMLPNQSAGLGSYHELIAPYMDYNHVDNIKKHFRDRIGEPPEGAFDNPAVDFNTRSGNYADYGLNIWVSGWESDDPANKGKSLHKTWRATQIPEPSKTIWFTETINCSKNVRGDWGLLAKPHAGETVNILYLDGHLELVAHADITANYSNNDYPWAWPGRN